MTRWPSIQARWLACLVAISFSFSARASDDPEIHLDGSGDAIARRTDAGADGPINPNSNLPDLNRIVVGGWIAPNPRNDRYSGTWDDPRDVDLMRIDVVFAGLVNPPGALNLQGEGYDPYRFGESPVFGYVEFDIDGRRDTGGEITGVRNRPLGNASRFGGRLSGSIGEEAAVTGLDFDDNLCSGPEVERSGEEVHLSLCGCHPFTSVTPIGDPTPQTFDAGDTWLLRGRLFRRTHAFSEFSRAFNGSEPGEYDPTVEIRFQHNIATNETAITLVYPLTMRGAADLTGQQQQGHNLNVNDHTSIYEMLYEIRDAAVGNNGSSCTPYDLLRRWTDGNHAPEEFEDFIRVDQWEALALFGTAYAAEQKDAAYVWTDVGPEFHFGDCNGDRFINETDQMFVTGAIAQSDGLPGFDLDGRVNGQTVLRDFARNFALYDLDYDGRINSLDLALIGYERLGDVNCDRAVNQTDLTLLDGMLGERKGNLLFNPAADLDSNDIIDLTDRSLLVALLRIGGQGSPTKKSPIGIRRTDG